MVVKAGIGEHWLCGVVWCPVDGSEELSVNEVLVHDI